MKKYNLKVFIVEVKIMKYIRGLRGHILRSITLVVIVNMALVMGFLQFVLQDSGKQAAWTKAKSDLATGRALLEVTYPGEWEVRGDELYKGDVLMNENYETIDYLGSLTGNTVTIFLGDTRIATNVINAQGKRAIGTKVSDVVADAVLKKGEMYVGDAVVVDHLYQTAYEPIRNVNGDVIGIWYMGTSSKFVSDMVWSTQKGMIYIGLLAIIVSILQAMRVATKLARDIEKIREGINLAENRVLTHRINLKRKDEIGDLAISYNHMSERLGELIESVDTSANDVLLASKDLEHAAEEQSKSSNVMAESVELIADGARNQLDAIDATKNIVDSMNEGINRIHNNALEAFSSTEEAVNVADDGRDKIESSIKQMERINQKSHETAVTMKELGERSQEIGNIINMISNIAEQTNLLALNASIEAARAGEHGRGFAVVADEVRKLAEQSSDATSQIGNLVQDIMNNIDVAVVEVETNASNIEDGVNSVKQASSFFTQLRDSSNEVSNKVRDINDFANDIKSISMELVKQMEAIDSVARNNADGTQNMASMSEEQSASFEEINATISSMTRIAENLKEKVSEFSY